MCRLLFPEYFWLNSFRFVGYLEDVGFFKEREISFPHKQAALMKITRDGWTAPVL